MLVDTVVSSYFFICRPRVWLIISYTVVLNIYVVKLKFAI